MVREDIEKIPGIADVLLDESVITDTRENLRKRLNEVCDMAIKTLEQDPRMGMTYALYKKSSATDDYTRWGTYDVSDQRQLEAMLRAVFRFGGWVYNDFKIEQIEPAQMEEER